MSKHFHMQNLQKWTFILFMTLITIKTPSLQAGCGSSSLQRQIKIDFLKNRFSDEDSRYLLSHYKKLHITQIQTILGHLDSLEKNRNKILSSIEALSYFSIFASEKVGFHIQGETDAKNLEKAPDTCDFSVDE